MELLELKSMVIKMVLKNISRLLFCIAAITAVCLCIRLFYTNNYNKQLEAEFLPNDRYMDYLSGVELDKIDLAPYYRYAFSASAFPEIQTKITLDRDIYYYEAPDETSQVKIKLDQGRTYIVRGDHYASMINGCKLLESRYMSWPSYTHGWRYALPLLTEEDYDQFPTGDAEALIYGYVRLEDLEYIFHTCQDTLMSTYYPNLVENIHQSDKYPDSLFYWTDHVLYDNGFYISPDLYLNYWNWQEFVLLLIFSGAMLGGAAACVKSKRQSKKLL